LKIIKKFIKNISFFFVRYCIFGWSR
jgi:hypothetical protein